MSAKYIFKFCFFVVLLAVSCKDRETKQVKPMKTAGDSYYTEPYRSQFHFTPEEKWMNDPNGLVYNEGVYHLFYQYYPEDIVWDPCTGGTQ